eukprot:1157321-Pelagomonas_calceolata.AAC.4
MDGWIWPTLIILVCSMPCTPPVYHCRTLAMLQILQMDHSPEASNQALPSFQAMCASCAGNACPHLDSKNREARCDNLGPQNGTTSTACTQSLEAGVCIATPVPALGEPAIVASPAAAGCPPTDSSLHAGAAMSCLWLFAQLLGLKPGEDGFTILRNRGSLLQPPHHLLLGTGHITHDCLVSPSAACTGPVASWLGPAAGKIFD